MGILVMLQIPTNNVLPEYNLQIEPLYGVRIRRRGFHDVVLSIGLIRRFIR